MLAKSFRVFAAHRFWKHARLRNGVERPEKTYICRIDNFYRRERVMLPLFGLVSPDRSCEVIIQVSAEITQHDPFFVQIA